MDIARHGIILNVEKYRECVAFYRELFGLKVLFETPDLTCLEFGSCYLMIEKEGVANPRGKSMDENSTKLRFNVPDVERALQKVRAYGIHAAIERHPWGSTINLHDPDGNRIGIRDEAGFVDQLR